MHALSTPIMIKGDMQNAALIGCGFSFICLFRRQFLPVCGNTSCTLVARRYERKRRVRIGADSRAAVGINIRRYLYSSSGDVFCTRRVFSFEAMLLKDCVCSSLAAFLSVMSQTLTRSLSKTLRHSGTQTDAGERVMRRSGGGIFSCRYKQ